MTTAPKNLIPLLLALILATLSVTAGAAPRVGITADIGKVEFTIDGKRYVIERNQDTSATVDPAFAKTSRPCPPFCIQPMRLAPGVETIGELEVIDYLKRQASGEPVLVIDSRTPDWVARGTIPGATNIPWTGINVKQGATTEGIVKILTRKFGVKLAKGADEFAVDEAIVDGDTSEVFNFSKAKTLVLFCNGMWCGQSPNNIINLLKFGYPPEKLKWYRGGMQDWASAGLTMAYN